jgi:hypothetical protein
LYILRLLGLDIGIEYQGVGLSNQRAGLASLDLASERSLVLCLKTQVLTKQFEGLLKLREQVRKAEAKAIGLRRYVGRRYKRKRKGLSRAGAARGLRR